MIVRTAPLGPFATNAYVVGCARTHTAAIIDPSSAAHVLDAMLQATPALELRSIFQTHGHVDHVGAIPELRRQHGAVPVFLHDDERPVYDSAAEHGRLFGIRLEALPEPDVKVADNDLVEIGELRARAIHTPGHTPGSVCYYFEEQGVVFTGDLLFAGSIGRTDLPGGDTPLIKASLAQISELPDATVVLSGHGPMTTIGRENKTNPFLQGFF